MGVTLSHDDALVTQQFLHLVNIHPVLNEPRRKGVSQVMKMEIVDPVFSKALS